MAKRSIPTLKGWFETGDFPTQQQFTDWLDSFLHLDAQLQMSNIQDLVTTLAAKADASQLAALNSKVVLAAGTASWNVPAGTLIEKIWVIEPTTITFKAGTTNGGNDLIEGEQFIGQAIIAKDIPYQTAGTIYFGGITGNTITIIFKR